MPQSEFTTEVLADSPWVFYKFDEASGTPQDSSGNARHVSSIDGSFNYQQTGPMTGSYSCISTQPLGAQFNRNSPPSDTTISIEMWVKLGQTPGSNGRSVYITGNTDHGIEILVNTDGKFYCVIHRSAGAGGNVTLATSTAAITTSAFRHIVITYDSGTWKYYVDGTVDTSNAGTTTMVDPSSQGMHVNANYASDYKQYVSNYAYYTSTLSSTRVAAHYNAALPSGQTINAPFISSSTTMYAPTVTFSSPAPVNAPFISASTTLYAPTVGPFILPPLITPTTTLYTPTLSSSGAGSIAAPFIPSSTTIYTPGVFKPVVSHGITGQDARLTFYVDHLDHDGDVIATFQPINLRWTYRLGQDGPGEIFYGIALSDPAVTRDGFAPYATDFLLRVDITDGTSTNSYDLMAGPHTPVNMKLVDGTIEGVVWVSGKDWLHWLDQPYTSWDYDTPIDEIVATLDPTKLHGIYSAANGDTIQDVILDLLAPLSDDPTNQIILTPEFNGTAFAELIDYVLWRTDGTNVSDHLKTLAHLNDPKGFDFWVDPDKTIKFFGPHRMNPNFVTPVFSFGAGYTGDEEFQPLVAIDWTNNGPLATKTIGLGIGNTNTTRYSTSTYGPSVALYRRWTRFADLTDSSADADAQQQVDALTDMRGYLDRFPQKELRLTVKPEFADPTDAVSLLLCQVAAVIDVDFDFAPYHRIDAEFYITSQEFYMDAAGNLLCDLTLDQIYA